MPVTTSPSNLDDFMNPNSPFFNPNCNNGQATGFECDIANDIVTEEDDAEMLPLENEDVIPIIVCPSSLICVQPGELNFVAFPVSWGQHYTPSKHLPK